MLHRALEVTAALAVKIHSHGRRVGLLTLFAVLTMAGSAMAQHSFLLPLAADDPLELGTAWDREDNRARGEDGACVVARETERQDGGPTTYSLVVLSRAGGRLLLGVHVARSIASEGIVGARITDAARRLASRDREGFDALCGSGFLAARTVGGHYVGELEFEPGEARRASAGLRTGVWTDSTPFAATIEELLAGSRARAREIPGGRRSEAREIEPSVLLSRALAFPETVTETTARPFLGAIHRYPDAAFAGTEMSVDPTLGWGDAARQVFLHDRTTLSGSSAAVRAAEMRKAMVQRRQPTSAPRPRELPPPAAAIGVLRAEEAPMSSPPPARVAVLRRRMAALVYTLPDGSTVFATTEAPPGVYAEKVKQREYWIPGIAAPDATLRAALARAAQEPPGRGTTIIVAEVGAIGVVLTDVAPANGIHAVPDGALHAWIAGVQAPTPAQHEALAAAVQAGD